METTNRPLVEKRSCKYAVMGIMMAFTSVKPVVSHWAVAASTLISSMMEGRAGVTTVWLSTVINAPKTSTVIMAHCLRVKFIPSPLPSCPYGRCTTEM